MMCRLYQMWINRGLDDDRPLSARVERHLAGCEACRRWHEHQLLVIQRLQADRRTAASTEGRAAEAIEVALPFLRARILNAIRADARRETPASIAGWAWVGAAAAAVALVIIAGQSSPKPVALVFSPNEPASVEVPKVATTLIEATTRFADGGRLWQVATNLDRPLQEEMHLVFEDARAALRSLQLEFVPSTLLAKRD